MLGSEANKTMARSANATDSKRTNPDEESQLMLAKEVEMPPVLDS